MRRASVLEFDSPPVVNHRTSKQIIVGSNESHESIDPYHKLPGQDDGILLDQSLSLSDGNVCMIFISAPISNQHCFDHVGPVEIVAAECHEKAGCTQTFDLSNQLGKIGIPV